MFYTYIKQTKVFNISYHVTSGPCSLSGAVEISLPRVLAECRKRLLNQRGLCRSVVFAV